MNVTTDTINKGDRYPKSIIKFKKVERTSHPTQKPVDLFLWTINKFKVDFNIVLDVFLGSGSTLIGAEKLGKVCYGMEMDEHFCNVLINRWEQYTGKIAEKING